MSNTDRRLQVLRMAVAGTLPKQIGAGGEHEELLEACFELEGEGYIEGGTARNSTGQPWNFVYLNMTSSGRDLLNELESRTPVGRIKAKSGDILLAVLTSAITSVVTAILTYIVMEKLKTP